MRSRKKVRDRSIIVAAASYVPGMDEERINQSEIPASFPTKANAIRRVLAIHQPWIEQTLGIPLSGVVIVEVQADLTQIATERILRLNSTASIPNGTLRRMRTVVADIAVPPEVPPVLEMVDRLASDDLLAFLGGTRRKKRPRLEWGDCPIALRFHIGSRLVAINVSYFDGPASSYESTAKLVITRRDQARELIGLLAHISRKDRRPRIVIQDGPTRRIVPCRWDDLILDQSVLSLVREDLTHFFERRAWFRKNKLPFRRGFLFFGPPGNGKTSVIRAILSSYGMTAYTLTWFAPNKSDEDLDRLFEDAVKDVPSLILLEDIDRAFPKTGETRSNISLQQLLNCLDGVGTADGTIVIATANDPTLLDPAVLRRPGRFDRVVHFANPNYELRLKYFLKFNPQVEANHFHQAVTESEGFSFAYLKEAFVVAGQTAFQRNEDINADDLLDGVRTLRRANVKASETSKSAGFGSTRATRAETIEF